MRNRILLFIIIQILMIFVYPTVVKSCDEWEEPSDSVELIIWRYQQAVDPLENITNRESLQIKGKIITDLKSRREPVYEDHQFTILAKNNDLFYMVEWTDSGRIERGFDGVTGWRKDRLGIADDKSTGNSKLAWLANPQNAFAIERYFPGLTYGGIDYVNGKSAYVLYPEKLPKEHYALYFDTESNLLIRIGYYWEIEDYRKVDGVLYPHRITTSRKGGSTTYFIDEILPEIDISLAIFEKPEE